LTDAIAVGSKWGYTYVGSWRLDAPVHEVKDLSVETLRRQIIESRALIGDRLQLYQIHSATLESKVLENVDVLRELLRLRASGLVIGLTVTGPNQADVIRRALRVSIDGVNPFQVVQATWNLLERSAGAALAEAKALGWGVIVKEALANGRLTDRANGAHVRALKTEAVARRTTIDALALAAALSQPWLDVVLSGAVTVAQLESNFPRQDIRPRTAATMDVSIECLGAEAFIFAVIPLRQIRIHMRNPAQSCQFAGSERPQERACQTPSNCLLCNRREGFSASASPCAVSGISVLRCAGR